MAMVCVTGARECTGCMACLDDPYYGSSYICDEDEYLDYEEDDYE